MHRLTARLSVSPIKAILYSLAVTLLTLVATSFDHAQTFRGGINGVVTDHTGGAIPKATVVATDTETGSTHTTTTSSAGEYFFQDLPLGTYSVAASFPGFNTVKTDKVVVSAGTTYTLAIKLTISATSTVIEVDASTIALDTTTSTQTTVIEQAIVSDTPTQRARLHPDDRRSLPASLATPAVASVRSTAPAPTR